jgi:hypothetical protein
VQVAVPLARFTALQPAILLPPSVNLTVPVGDEPPVIVTVKVTGWPNFVVYREESMPSFSAAGAPSTVCVIGPATPAV